MRKYLLPESGNFYKANLHCHSTVSDGALTPEQIKEEYMKKGYSVVAYTDHNVMIDHSDLTDDKFLALRGFEIDVNENYNFEAKKRARHKVCHICLIAKDPDNYTQICWDPNYPTGNAKNYVPQVVHDETKPIFPHVYSPECINTIFKEGKENGFFTTYNHPNWSLETYDQYSKYHGMSAMEIANYGCIEAGYDDYNPGAYDEILFGGERIYCVAADDNHNRPNQYKPDPLHDSFGCFNVIKAENLEYRTITKALEDGNFYASQGPEIYELYFEDGMVHIKCSPVRTIQIRKGCRRHACIDAPKGETITEMSFPVDLEKDTYFRLTIIDKEGYPANTNAYFCDTLMD